MPRPDKAGQVFDGQDDWSGGMSSARPGPNQFAYGRNIHIRGRRIGTRPGIKRALTAAGYISGFWFNQDNAYLSDATHTGFWFSFQFATNVWNKIQGVEVIRLPADNNESLLLVHEGNVYQLGPGYVKSINSASVDSDESITFTQAQNVVVMWRGEDLPPLQWDGSDTGFIEIPAPATGDPIPYSVAGLYAALRLWAFRDRSILGASDILDFWTWDLTTATFAVQPGDGDELTALYPFHEDTILAFKGRSIHALTGIFAGTLSSGLSRIVVDNQHGCVSRRGIVTYGEKVAYMALGGIHEIQRNEQNKLMGVDVPLSWPIQELVDRINWRDSGAIAGICAANSNNYLMWAVPLDGSLTNNAILVYDILADGGNGAWVGLWQSQQTKVRQFFTMNGVLFFLGYDGVPRQMLTDEPWDSEHPYDDTAAYDTLVRYQPGDLVSYEVAGDKGIYRAIAYAKGNAPTDAAYWEQELDVDTLYDIESEVVTRQMRHSDWGVKSMGRCEVNFRHQDPCVSLSVSGEDYQTEQELYSSKLYSQLEYDIVKADWDPSNVNLDARYPHRKDYTFFIREPRPDQDIDNSLRVVDAGTGVCEATWTGTLTIGQEYRLIWETGARTVVAADPKCSIRNGEYYFTPLSSPYVVTFTLGTGSALFAKARIAEPCFLCDETGFDLSVWERHSLRFHKRLLNDRSIGLRILNAHGKLEIENIMVAAEVGRHAYRGR